MGSNFFRGRELGPVGAMSPNSTFGRAVNNDPVSNFLFGKQRQVLPTAGPYAGYAPSLAAANGGYATQANGAAATTAQPGQSAQLRATFGAGYGQ